MVLDTPAEKRDEAARLRSQAARLDDEAEQQRRNAPVDLARIRDNGKVDLIHTTVGGAEAYAEDIAARAAAQTNGTAAAAAAPGNKKGRIGRAIRGTGRFLFMKKVK